MKRKLLFVFLTLFLLSILYGVKEYFRTHKDLQHEPATATMNAMDLIRVFEQDSSQSSRVYIDQVIVVNGRIKNISNEEHPVVISLGEDSVLSSVQCSMDSTHTETLKQVAIGKRITIKGMCLGAISQEMFGTDVKLNRCVIVPES